MINSNLCQLPFGGVSCGLDGPFNHLLANADSQGEATRQMLQVINAQNVLIMKLLHKQNILYQDLHQAKTSSESSEARPVPQPFNTDSAQPQQEGALEHFNEDSLSSLAPMSPQSNKRVPSVNKSYANRMKPLKKVVFQDDAHSSGEEVEGHTDKRRQAESKNMIKNFAKGIFNFIRKQPKWRNQLLEKLGVKQEQFMRAYAELKGNIRSISELRTLWSQPNPFCRVFRMLSFEYLRKHSLRKIFNSRIYNYSLHLKYRRRLLEALSNPEDFTALKID